MLIIVNISWNENFNFRLIRMIEEEYFSEGGGLRFIFQDVGPSGLKCHHVYNENKIQFE